MQDIAAVLVVMHCRDEGDPMGITVCRNRYCVKCSGQGTYIKQLPWEDFAREVREKLEPAPDSQG